MKRGEISTTCYCSFFSNSHSLKFFLLFSLVICYSRFGVSPFWCELIEKCNDINECLSKYLATFDFRKWIARFRKAYEHYNLMKLYPRLMSLQFHFNLLKGFPTKTFAGKLSLMIVRLLKSKHFLMRVAK